jgi:septum site-determining protein MinD
MGRDTVYAVASGKGGVGKTTTTVNLGTALAKAGHRVVVVDADMGMANLAAFVSLGTDEATLDGVLAGEAGLDDAIYPLAGDLFAVPSGTDLETYSEASPEGLTQVVDALRSAFDFVLLDVGAGVSHETVLPLGLADGVLLVSTPDPAAVQNTLQSTDLVDRAGGRIEGLVLTRLHQDDAVDAPAIAERFPGRLLARIPEDDAVRRSLRAGRPVVVDSPDSPAAKAYGELASRVLKVARGGSGAATDADGRQERTPPAAEEATESDGEADDPESAPSLDLDFDG